MMIGFQQQAVASHGKGPNSQQQQQLPQLSQHCQNMSLASTSPAHRPVSSASSSTSSPSPTHQTTSSNEQQQQHLHARQPHKTTTSSSRRRVSSPGYHSAASSPGSSSIASPVSSSSGVSSAASSLSCNRTSILCSPQPPASSATSQRDHRARSPHQTIVSCTTASVSHGNFHAEHAANSPPIQVVSKIPQSNSSSQQVHNKPTSNGPLRATGPTMSPGGTLASLLDHFPEINHNGLRLSWFPNANNRQTLDRALASSKLIIAGDISLAEMSRYPVPIMARPPLGVSDLTLETWLSDVIQSRKGIKLTFTSTRTVEPAFRVLARHAQNLKGPLILSADILARSSCANIKQQQQQSQQLKQQEQQPVDAWTFLMLCRTRFPRSIISIGWCAPTASNQQHTGLVSRVQPADSSSGSSSNITNTIVSGPDSMFELDMMTMEQQQHQAPPVVSQPHHFSQPILHLSSAPSNQQQRLNSLNVVQQLAAVAAAAAANNGNHNNNNNLNHQQHFILSSNGSLNSSSGNSSGSPSPTSPISHLMRNHRHQQHNVQIRQHQRHVSSQPQVVGGWPAMAAAAMVAANNLRQRCHLGLADEEDEEEEEEDGEDDRDEAQDDDDEDQLPLNLNINEADPQHATPQGALNDLAQKIHSLQQQSNNLNTLTSSLSKTRSHPLASHSNNNNNNSNQCRWEHISKKAALAHRLNADSPSPVSTSPKQQANQHNHHHHQHHHHYNQQQQLMHPHQTTGGHLLCVKAPHSLSNNNHHHHSLANLALATQEHSSSSAANSLRHTTSGQTRVAASDGGALGYTREMIDKMASLVKEYNLTQAITFPVEARLMLRNNSLAELQRLLYQVGAHSTLTIVAQQEDLISVDDLLLIRKHFAAQQLLFDLPDELAASLRQELDR